MYTLYIYKVVREYADGTQGKRAKTLCRYEPDLEIGGMYANLGAGYPVSYTHLTLPTNSLV